MSFDLVVRHGPHRGKVIPIKPSAFVIGRGSQCHLRPASPEVSERHCTLVKRDGKAFVQDLNSAGGTFVNRQKVEGERELANADQLKVGPLEFEVRIAAAKPKASPSAAAVAADLQRDGDVLVVRSPAADATPAALSAEDAEEIAAAELLAGDGAPTSPESDTGVIALASSDTVTLPTRPPIPGSSEAAKAILNEYRQRRNGRTTGNNRPVPR